MRIMSTITAATTVPAIAPVLRVFVGVEVAGSADGLVGASDSVGKRGGR